MTDTLYKRICIDCGCVFWHTQGRKQLCAECEKSRHREAVRRSRLKKRKKKGALDIPLHRLVFLLERYNTENKTSITYGAFVEMLKVGKIKLKEVIGYELENRSDKRP